MEEIRNQVNDNKRIIEQLGIKVGDEIRIIRMDGNDTYRNKKGVVKEIDKAYQLKGTWGNSPIIPRDDTFEIVKYH